MKALENIAKNVRSLNLVFVMKKLFDNKEFRDLITYLNTWDQLYDFGIDSTGKSIGDYAYNTIHGRGGAKGFPGKIEKGQPYDRVTLRDKGDFYKSFKVKFDAGDFVITTNPIKNGISLLDTWGKDVLGLTEENLGKLREKAKEILIPIVKEQILKNAA